MIRVGVIGATGKVGAEVCRAVHAADDLELAGAISRSRAGAKASEALGLEGSDLLLAEELRSFEAAGVEVAVDFTKGEYAPEHVEWAIEHGVHVVVGTTGFEVDEVWRNADVGVVVAPNFAIGAVLMMRFAELAAPWFETAEIIELHHDQKVDAPSGTAMLTVERMAKASGDWAPDPTKREVLAGARGATGPGGIPVHSVRLRGLVAHQEVLLGTTGQTLTIRHDSYDRSSFMPGVLLAVKQVPHHPGVTIGLDGILGL